MAYILISVIIIKVRDFFRKDFYMEIQYLILIAIALAMDAFGVTLGIGLNNCLYAKHKIKTYIT